MIDTPSVDLYTPSRIWAHLLRCDEDRVDELCLSSHRESYVCRWIRGKRCRTKDQLLQEWAAALQFPWYFGHNWDAFDECICDLGWLPADGYILYITTSDLLLPDDEALITFLKILHDTAAYWKADRDFFKEKPIKSFHVVFHFNSPENTTKERFINLFRSLAISWSELVLE